MKHLKKILGMIIAMTMLCGVAVTSIATDIFNVYYDYSADEWNNTVYAEEYVLSDNIEKWITNSDLLSPIPEQYVNSINNAFCSSPDEEAYINITKLINCPDSNGIFVSFEGFVRQYQWDFSTSTPIAERVNNPQIGAAVVDIVTGVPISVEKHTLSSLTYDETNYSLPGRVKCGCNALDFDGEQFCFFRLPDNFDSTKHKLVFFFFMNYTSAYYNINDIEYSHETPWISAAVEADLSKITSWGDANSDGKINIADVSMILKHIAKWKLGTFDEISADLDLSTSVNLHDAQMLLKQIAGWDDEDIYTEYYMEGLVQAYDSSRENRPVLLRHIGTWISYAENVRMGEEPVNGFTRMAEEEIIATCDYELRCNIWHYKKYGFSYEVIKNNVVFSPAAIKLSEYNGWSIDKLSEYVKNSYDAEFYF